MRTLPLGPARRQWRLPLPALALALLGVASVSQGADESLKLRLRSRVELTPGSGRFQVVEKAAAWQPKETAIIVCDMWDLHHCLNAVRRETEMAPRMNQVIGKARDQGVLVIHAPSSCMDAYKDHPARKRAIETPRSKTLPVDIGKWCYRIPQEERGVYPIDQSNGGEDDDLAEHKEWAAKLAAMGRNPRAPWKSQTDMLTISADADVISDSGEEIWSVLEDRGIKNLILMGVHANMCVLGRPFGLRQMAKNGKNVVLMRDMTDTMYDPNSAPYVSHFTGTDLIVEHVEKYVCPSITSEQVLGGAPLRFKGDKRPHVVFVVAEDEYRTETTLPVFAASQLGRDYHVSYVFASESDPNDLAGMSVLEGADVAVISVRRRLPTGPQLDAARKFVADGKSIIGIRTASHAFAPAGKNPVPEGHAAWTSFDADVLGGNYHGHHKEGPKVAITPAAGSSSHPVLKGVDVAKLVGHGSLYRVSPLQKDAVPLLIGTIPGRDPEPVAWVNTSPAKGRVFYTSLGQVDDFSQAEFNRLLRNAIDWAGARETPAVASRP